MLITYITSHFGSAEDLRRCVSSVYKDFYSTNLIHIELEHLIYLDGFKDTRDRYSFLASYPHVRVFNSPISKGKSYAVNFLLSKANGEYIFLLDSDDWNLIGRTLFSLDYHRKTNISSLLLGSNYLQWNRSGMFSESNYPLDDKTIKLKFWAFPYLLYSSISFHRSILDHTEFHLNETLSSGVDYELYSRVFSKVKVQNMSQRLVVYSVTPGGMTRSKVSRAKQLLSHQICLANLLSISNTVSTSELSSLIILYLTGSLTTKDRISLRSKLAQYIQFLDNNPESKINYFPDSLSLIDLRQEFQSLLNEV